MITFFKNNNVHLTINGKTVSIIGAGPSHITSNGGTSYEFLEVMRTDNESSPEIMTMKEFISFINSLQEEL